MDKVEEARSEAKSRLLAADHMATFTYPVINDSRMLMGIVENIFLALTGSLAALLYSERALRKIPPFYDTFDSKFHVFREDVGKRYSLSKYSKLLIEVRDLLIAHRESPVEFSKGGAFIMCSENYTGNKTVTIEKVKEYLAHAKQFFHEVDRITKQNAMSLGSKG
ncbi:MAG: hypothetical protein V1702_01665 [Candidatus Woesearchaeota archaeon]